MSSGNRNANVSDYRPEIDGLRAIAVIAVVMFHLGLGCPGGFVGVDIFFVISGFLITGIVQRRIENKTFSFTDFFSRRIKRIFPALAVMIITSIAAGYLILLPDDLAELGKSSVAQALFVANFHFASDTGYFAGPAELKPLLHTWSLAVEEQFYFIFPILLFILQKLNRGRLVLLLAAACLISFSASIYGVYVFPTATFFLLPTRAWELLAGCLLALSPRKYKSSGFRDNVIAALGLFVIVVPIFAYDRTTPFPGAMAFPPVFGTALVILATSSSQRNQIRSTLSCQPLVFIGLISYSLYLWHWPVIVFTRIYFEHLDWKQIIFATTISSLLSVLSWRYVETPFRNKKIIEKPKNIFCIALSTNILLIIISVFLVTTNGLDFRFPNYSSVLSEDTKWNGSEFAFDYEKDLVLHYLPTLGMERPDLDSNPDFIVWGDSHGMVLCNLIDFVAKKHDLYGKAIVHSGFLPVPNIKVEIGGEVNHSDVKIKRKVMQLLDKYRPKHLLLIARWARYLGYSSQEFNEEPVHLIDDNKRHSPEKPGAILQRNLKELVSFCETRGMSVWIVKQVPETAERYPARQLLAYVLGRKKNLSDKRKTIAEYEQMVEPVDKIFETVTTHENTQLIITDQLLWNDNERTINYEGSRSIYRDFNHLTRLGLEKTRPAMDRLFEEFSKQQND